MNANRDIILLTGLGLVLYSYAIDWGLPNVNDWTNLSLAPLKPLSYAKHLLAQESWLYHYPPFHFAVLAIAYSPYVLWLSLTGGLSSPSEVYPYGLTNPELSLSVFTLIARFVSVAMGVGTIIVNYCAIKRFYDRGAAFIAAFFIATSYPIVHYSHNANVDIPQLFWFSLGLYSFISLLEDPKTKYYIMLGLFAAFAFTTKESIYAAFVGIAIVIAYVHFINGYKAKNSLIGGIVNTFDVKILLGLLVFGVAAILIFNPITNWEGFSFHIDRHSLRSIRGNWVIRDASSKIQGHIELIYHYFLYIFQSSGLGVFVLLIGGFTYCFIKSPARSAILLVPIITYYLFFLRIHGTHHLRYMLPVYLLLLWFTGKFSSDLLRQRNMLRFVAWLFVGLAAVYALYYGASVNLMYINDGRYEAERWMMKNISGGSSILAVEPDYSLPRLPENLVIVRRDLWDFHGNVIDDIKDIEVDYIVLGMSIPRRRERKDDIERFFYERGFQEIASFRGEYPLLVREVPNLHTINPRITILRRER